MGTRILKYPYVPARYGFSGGNSRKFACHGTGQDAMLMAGCLSKVRKTIFRKLIQSRSGIRDDNRQDRCGGMQTLLINNPLLFQPDLLGKGAICRNVP